MKYINGFWLYLGQSYPSLKAALLAVWPKAGKKEAAPGTANTGSGKVKHAGLNPPPL